MRIVTGIWKQPTKPGATLLAVVRFGGKAGEITLPADWAGAVEIATNSPADRAFKLMNAASQSGPQAFSATGLLYEVLLLELAD